jgi:hypothetical protein
MLNRKIKGFNRTPQLILLCANHGHSSSARALLITKRKKEFDNKKKNRNFTVAQWQRVWLKKKITNLT